MSDTFYNAITVGGTFNEQAVTRLLEAMKLHDLSLGGFEAGVTRECLEEQIKVKGEALQIVGRIPDSCTEDFLGNLREMNLSYHNHIESGDEYDAEIRAYASGDAEERQCTSTNSGSVSVDYSTLEGMANDRPDLTMEQMLEVLDLEIFDQQPTETSFQADH